jgi:hypothetical protein
MLPEFQGCAMAATAQLLLGLDHLGQFLAQLRAIVMTMHGDGVLHGRVYKFLPGICRNRDRAVHLAWVLTTIHKHSGHLDLPWHDDSQHSPFLSYALGSSNIKRSVRSISTVANPVQHESQGRECAEPDRAIIRATAFGAGFGPNLVPRSTDW